MRIIHDVTTPMSASGGGKPYSVGPGKQGYYSMQVDLLLCEDCASNHPDLPEGMFGGDEAIYIEGDSKYIIKMLEDALAVLRLTEKYHRERLGEMRSTNCPDGCADIDKFNGIHEITCPKHVNYEHFRVERETKAEVESTENGTAAANQTMPEAKRNEHK